MSRAGSWGHSQGLVPGHKHTLGMPLQAFLIHRDGIFQPGARPRPCTDPTEQGTCPQGQGSREQRRGPSQSSTSRGDRGSRAAPAPSTPSPTQTPGKGWQQILPQRGLAEMPKIWAMSSTPGLWSALGGPCGPPPTQTACSNWEPTAAPAQGESGGTSTRQPSRGAGNEELEEFVFQAPSGCCFQTICPWQRGKGKTQILGFGEQGQGGSGTLE